MQGMGKLVPYVIAGTVNTNTPKIGTAPYSEPSSGDLWYHISWEYGCKGTMALGLFLDGSIRMIDRTNGVQINDLFSQQTNLP